MIFIIANTKKGNWVLTSVPMRDIILSMSTKQIQLFRANSPVWKTRPLTRHDIQNHDLENHQVDCLTSLDRIDSHLSPDSGREKAVFLARNNQNKIWHIANLEDSDPLNSYPYEYRYNQKSGILEATAGKGFKIDLRSSFAYLDKAIRDFPNLSFHQKILAKSPFLDQNSEAQRINEEYKQALKDYRQSQKG